MDDCGPLNTKYRCLQCGLAKTVGVMTGLHAKSGPEYDHWLDRTGRALDKLRQERDPLPPPD